MSDDRPNLFPYKWHPDRQVGADCCNSCHTKFYTGQFVAVQAEGFGAGRTCKECLGSRGWRLHMRRGGEILRITDGIPDPLGGET